MSALEETEKSVLRQALIEYTSRRRCYDSLEDEDETRENLRAYVAARYCTHSEKFRADKLEALVPRIRAAYSMLTDLAKD